MGWSPGADGAGPSRSNSSQNLRWQTPFP